MDRAQTTWPTGDLHRRAPAVLKMQINKSERNDAADNARTSQALLTKIKRDLGNQIRGLFKNIGLVGRAKFNVFAARTEKLIDIVPSWAAWLSPPLAFVSVLMDAASSTSGPF